jgi:hypothetical protein
MLCRQTALIVGFVGLLSAHPAMACPINYGSNVDAKPNKLYLYFPAVPVTVNVDPAVFPPHGFDPDTKWLPLPEFDTSKLSNYRGTAAQLRDAIHEVVTDIYCEFNVQVVSTRTPPPNLAERRNVVAIGTDMAYPCGHPRSLYGQSNTAGGDPGDSKPIDFARVWAGSFNCSNLDRMLLGWAHTIGSTAAHEAAHNYGLSHADGEGFGHDLDDFFRHLMQEGARYKPEQRASPRHFSNFETSVLARNVGLSIDTMWTWDFINRSTNTATMLRMELLSQQKELILSWVFAGPTSPWVNPVLSGPAGTRVINDAEYHVFYMEWSAGNPQWSGGSPGEVRPNIRFQIGATFSPIGKDRRRICEAHVCGDPDAVIISDVRLLDEKFKTLTSRPHWLGFDAGVFDEEGAMNVSFHNFLAQPLTLRDVVIRDLPRVMSINSMVPGEKVIRDIFGREFEAWKQQELLGNPITIQPGQSTTVAVARRSQGRHVSEQRRESMCRSTGAGRGLHCHAGITVDDLFPATTMYMTATVVDAAGVESRLFYQIAGRRARVP